MISCRTLVAAGCLLATGLFSSPAMSLAEDLAAPAGRVILSVSGDIAVTNANNAAQFDRAMLEALPQHRLETYTDWTEGPQVFEGPRLSTLLEHVGAEGDTLRATALNDYAVNIPAADASAFDVILAIRHNGKAMSVRDKGPIWVVYPNKSPDAAKADLNNDKAIWQLRSLDVR